MKKAHIIQLTSIVAFLVALILFINNTLTFQCSSDEVRLKLFYNEKENTMDVMLFGSSAVRAGFMPTRAYEVEGFTSYNYGVNHMPLPAAKYLITEAMQYQNPELIIIDINGITYCSEDFTETKSAPLINSIKDGENREAAKAELYGGTMSWEDEIPFVKFHKNLFRIKKCLRYKDYYEKYGTNATVLKGYTTNPVEIIDFSEKTLIDPNDPEYALLGPDDPDYDKKVKKFNKYEQKAVDDLLDFCDSIKDETQILFARFPRLTVAGNDEWELKYINAMEIEIVNRGYTYVDFYDYMDEANLDLAQDFNDNTHLTVFGAEKFTEFLAGYITDNYTLDIAGAKSDWNKCVTYANQYYELAKEATLINEGREYYEFDLARQLNVFGVK